jgi:hypothetical protein
MKRIYAQIGCFTLGVTSLLAQSKHSPTSGFPTYEGRVMCGYQGWFRAEGDGSGEGWTHYSERGPLRPATLHPDFWPDVSEYEKTYATSLTNHDGSVARVFSSWDQSTTDLHFRWMRQYGIDGVFVQRFFGSTRSRQARLKSRVVFEHALQSSRQYNRAIAVMYDLSGLAAEGEDCSCLIQDWKELVDELHITSQGTNQTYLYHRGEPLVAIWGLGFPDRPYNIRNIGMEKVLDFLKNDPQYGGCSVMLGVPTYFRELKIDTNPDPYLHELIAKADVVMPWMVQRFTPLVHQFDAPRYEEEVKADLAWCSARHLDYAPCVCPGFSWFNMHNHRHNEDAALVYPLRQIPRQKGRFYWSQISGAIHAQARMLYIAMFDEMDEGTAIFKCSNTPPEGVQLCDYEGMPTDHYLWLTGEAGKMLRQEVPFSRELPIRATTASR